MVDGKRAIDYFVDDKKIRDTMVLADMRLAGTIPTNVILFNIDSKSEMSGKQSKDAIVSVFLRVFNEMLGFCGAIPHLADLERKLSDDGRYEEFKEQFEEAKAFAAELSTKEVKLSIRSGEGGKSFGSITSVRYQIFRDYWE